MLRCSHWHHIPQVSAVATIFNFVAYHYRIRPLNRPENDVSFIVVTLAPDSSAHLESRSVLNKVLNI